MILQVADVGINRFLKELYFKEYTAALCMVGAKLSALDDVDRMGCIIHTIALLHEKRTLIIKCFERAGLLCCYRNGRHYFLVENFNSGLCLHDTSLPLVTRSYVQEVLSIRNLVCTLSAPVLVPLALLDEHMQALTAYASANEGVRKFYFSISTLAEVGGLNCKTMSDGNDQEESDKSTLDDGIRKLFKLGKAKTIAIGTPGRLPTAFGSFASARDQWEETRCTEEILRRNIV